MAVVMMVDYQGTSNLLDLFNSLLISLGMIKSQKFIPTLMMQIVVPELWFSQTTTMQDIPKHLRLHKMEGRSTKVN